MIILINLVHILVSLYSLAFVARTFVSMTMSPFHPVAAFLRRITEPVLAPIRRYIPPIQRGSTAWDLSPMIVILLLWAIEQFLTRILLTLVR